MKLRIIAGKLRGKKLSSVHGMATRPTSNRTRESIFNILASTVTDKVVLDLFAGTGAYGLEALSRGALHAVFVDSHRAADGVIHSNITSCRLEEKATFYRWNIQKNLNCLHGCGYPFNLVFIDPPYNRSLVATSLVNLAATDSLAEGATIVVEHSYLEPLSQVAPPFHLQDRRKYGKTLVSFLAYML